MNNIKSFDDEIINEWLKFREEKICSITKEEDNMYKINIEEISIKLLNLIPSNNKEMAKEQLDELNNSILDFLDYLYYWNEKYYRNGFVDGSQLVMGCFEE